MCGERNRQYKDNVPWKRKNARKDDRLVLPSPPHVVESVHSEPKDMWPELLQAALVETDTAVLVRVLLADGVAVALDVFVGVECDDGVGSEGGVDVVGHKAFAEDGDEGVVCDAGDGQSSEVCNALELFAGYVVHGA